MARVYALSGLAGCCMTFVNFSACLAAQTGNDTQSTPSSSAPQISSAPEEKKPGRTDSEHPFKIGAAYYPVESKRHGEAGWCFVRFQVDADGHIRAAQLTSSTGFERLDAACVTAVIDGQMIPATIDGQPVFYWPEMPIVWALGKPIARPTFDPFLVPKVRKDYQLKIGPDQYPAESRNTHEEGDCTVHGYVQADGATTNIAVSRTSGFAALDQACLSAIQQAPFVPAQSNGKPIGAYFDITISWRMPKQ